MGAYFLASDGVLSRRPVSAGEELRPQAAAGAALP
jgi:hypothetical protein